MKVLFRNITIGVFAYLLFSQMSFIDREFLGKYKYELDKGALALTLELNAIKHKFKTRISHSNIILKGTWKVEDENVILIYKEKYDKEPDTLKVKRLDNKIDSLGYYKKLNTED